MEINDDNFAKALADAPRPVLLVFGATFCGPSAWTKPYVEKAQEDLSDRVIVVPIDVEECPKLARQMQVKGTPTMLLLKRSEPIASRIGTMTWRSFTAFINESLAKGA